MTIAMLNSGLGSGFGSVNWGAIAGTTTLLGFVPYWLSILRGKTRPNRATWVIWSIVGVILSTSYWAAGARDTIWVPLSYVIGPIVTSLLGIRWGEGGWTRFDRRCLVGTAVSLLLWFILKSPLVALGLNLLIDFLGALPTIEKTTRDPEGEDRLAWVLFAIGNGFNLLAISEWSWAIAAYPIYLFCICFWMVVLLLRPRKLRTVTDSSLGELEEPSLTKTP
jgi:hypothetical protein